MVLNEHHDFINIGMVRFAGLFMTDFSFFSCSFFFCFLIIKKMNTVFVMAKHFNYNIVNYSHLTQTRDLSLPYILSFEILNIQPYELDMMNK